jgi:hypothetical protein
MTEVFGGGLLSNSSSFEVELPADEGLTSEISEVVRLADGDGGCHTEIRDVFALSGCKRFGEGVRF